MRGRSELSRVANAVIAIAIVLGTGIVWALDGTPRQVQSSYCPLATTDGIETPSPGPTHNVSPNATQYYANGSVIFWSGASGCTPPYTFTWKFGDGTPNLVVVGAYSGTHPYTFLHVYPGPGYYPGLLTIVDSDGHSSTTYYCVDASAWPMLGSASGNPAPHCGQ